MSSKPKFDPKSKELQEWERPKLKLLVDTLSFFPIDIRINSEVEKNTFELAGFDDPYTMFTLEASTFKREFLESLKDSIGELLNEMDDLELGITYHGVHIRNIDEE